MVIDNNVSHTLVLATQDIIKEGITCKDVKILNPKIHTVIYYEKRSYFKLRKDKIFTVLDNANGSHIYVGKYATILCTYYVYSYPNDVIPLKMKL